MFSLKKMLSFRHIFSKKMQQQKAAKEKPNNLYSILFIANNLKDYRRDMAMREVESLSELSMIGTSFSGVLHEADQFQNKLHEFEHTFANVNQTPSSILW